jgi:hypothetical protein
MTSRHRLALAGLAIVVAVITAMGIGAPATYGANTTADEPQYLLSAMSLWEDGNLDISDELADERYREFHEADLPQQTLVLEDGRQVSPHDPLLPVILAVPMGLGGWVAAKAGLAVLGGAVAALLAWTMITRLGVSVKTAVLTSAVFALSPPLAIYSTQVYPELPAALALLAGFGAVVGPFDRKARVVFFVSVVALPWLAVKFVPVAAVLALAGVFKAGKRQRAGLATALGLAAAIYVVGHVAIYGGLTAYATGDHFIGGELTAVGTQVNLWGRSSRLVGLLVDRGFGIGAWQPAYWILPLVAAWALRRSGTTFRVAAWIVGIGWLVATFVALTMHGWWFPGRQLVVVLPVAVALIGAWIERARPWYAMSAGVGGALGVVAFLFLLFEGWGQRLTWVVDFGTTANPMYQALSTIMPDYMTPTTTTWALHAVWVTVFVALALAGWRSASDGVEFNPSDSRDQAATNSRSAANSPTPTLLPPTETV